jgi:VWFA-related protein
MPVIVRGKYLFIPVFLAFLGFSYAVFLPEVGVESDKSRIAFHKGVLLHSDYKYSSSIDYFLDSLSYEPDFTLARRMLGQSLYFSGQVDEALNEWKNLLEQENYDPSLQIHIQNMRPFQVVAEPKWQFLRVIKGESGYQYAFPTFIAMLPNNNLVLLSQGQKAGGNVLVISSNGVFTENLRRISGKIGLPVGAAYDGKYLWITDATNDKIHRLSIEFKTLGTPSYKGFEAVGRPGGGNAQFHGPMGICFNGENIFVADQGNNRLQKLDKDGKFVQEIKTINRDMSLNQPFGVACDLKNIYVSEPNSSRVAQFDIFGNFIKFIGEGMFSRPRHLSINGKYLAVADENSGVFLIEMEKEEITHIADYMGENGKLENFYRPYSAQMDSLGNLFVADYAGHSLVQFVPEQFLYSNLEVWVERVYNKDYPNVGVWVSVKDQRGKYLTDLDSDNFALYENDADVGRLGVDYLKNFSNQASWVVINSKSLTMEKYADSLSWVGDFFLSKLREKDRVEAMSYTNTSRVEGDWTNSRLRVQQLLKARSGNDYKSENIDGLGKTLYGAVTELLPRKGRRAVILITDGNLQTENMSDFTLTRIENYAKINHIPVFIISFENPDIRNMKSKKIQLKEFAEKTGGKYFGAFDNSLVALEKSLRNTVEERYALTYQSHGKKSWKNQYMEIKVHVKFQGRNGMETSGYFIE